MAGMTGTISQPGTSRGRPLRVLLVDDDPLVRAGLRTILSSASDLDVVSEAADGSAAITAVRAHCVDVALMDVRMPGMDGITRHQADHRAARPAESHRADHVPP